VYIWLRIRREIREYVFTPRYAAYRGVKKKILYAFTEAVKVTFYKKKSAIGDLGRLMIVKIKF
jgi:hypothetical protein